MGRPQTVCVRTMSCIQIGKFTHTDLRFLMSRVSMSERKKSEVHAAFVLYDSSVFVT